MNSLDEEQQIKVWPKSDHCHLHRPEAWLHKYQTVNQKQGSLAKGHSSQLLFFTSAEAGKNGVGPKEAENKLHFKPIKHPWSIKLSHY